MKPSALLVSALTFATWSTISAAGDIEMSGFVSPELLIFQHAPAHPGQHESRLAPSLAIQPEFRYELGPDDRLTAIPFFRWDAWDSARTHADLREFNWAHLDDGWDLRVGVDRVFWGVTESRHLVDIINQTDLVEDLDGEDKLGQPMVNFGLQRDWGNLNLFAMPLFRERTFAGRDGRLRPPLYIDGDEAVYLGDASRRTLDLALRYSTVIGDWDIGLSQFHGVGREPSLIPGTNASGEPVLIPVYEIIDQTGVDVQVTKGAWLWKLEAVARAGQGETFAAFVGGFEYTIYDFAQSGIDLGLLAEYQYDGRDPTAPPTIHDNDLFLGLRLGFNDTRDSALLAALLVDHKTGARYASLEAETRLSDFWSLDIEALATGNLPPTDPGYGLRRDNHLLIRLTRYF
ncbi:MAG: hypothetical protein JSU82_18140 [Rhodospirillales bacterium]|nr:MAG: hypothetical protein JSU82_18140 [Rhodospirillales bacterium]